MLQMDVPLHFMSYPEANHTKESSNTATAIYKIQLFIKGRHKHIHLHLSLKRIQLNLAIYTYLFHYPAFILMDQYCFFSFAYCAVSTVTGFFLITAAPAAAKLFLEDIIQKLTCECAYSLVS